MEENQLTYNIYYNISVSPADMIIHQAAVAAAQHAGTPVPPAPTPIKEKLKQTIKRFSGGSQDDYYQQKKCHGVSTAFSTYSSIRSLTSGDNSV